MRNEGRRTLLLIALVCLLPVLASYTLFWFWKPAAGTNYGELLQPAPWQPADDARNDRFDPAALRGRWVMVYASGAACNADCRHSLWAMRQVRTAQGKEMDRLERVWLVTDGRQPDAALLAEHPGLKVVQLAGARGTGHIEVVDPQGNRMMRYPAQPEPKGMIKDFQRILKYSRTG